MYGSQVAEPITYGVIQMTSTNLQVSEPVDTKYLDSDQCGARYGFSGRHWQRLVDMGKAPKPTRFGRLVRWPIPTLEDWEQAGCPKIKGGRK